VKRIKRYAVREERGQRREEREWRKEESEEKKMDKKEKKLNNKLIISYFEHSLLIYCLSKLYTLTADLYPLLIICGI